VVVVEYGHASFFPTRLAVDAHVADLAIENLPRMPSAAKPDWNTHNLQSDAVSSLEQVGTKYIVGILGLPI
jgi:hypothetical protein